MKTFYAALLPLWVLHGWMHFDWAPSSILWVLIGAGISWYAHTKTCWTTFVFLLLHMTLEWADVGLHGLAAGWAGLVFLAHVPLDPALMWASLQDTVPWRRLLILISAVLVGMVVTAVIIGHLHGGHHHHHEHGHSDPLSFISWSGVVVCLGWHLAKK